MGVSVLQPLNWVDKRSAQSSALEHGSARLLAGYLAFVARTASFRGRDARGQPVDIETLALQLMPATPDDRIVLVYWGADAVAIAALPFLAREFHAVVRRITFLFDRTFGGHVCEGLIARLGGTSVVLDRPGNPARLEQLRDVMRRKASYAFAVDGGGPYFQVGSGVATLARTLKATVVPLAAAARPAIPWVHRSRISFPLPRCNVTMAVGDRIDARVGDRREVQAAIQRGLNSLGRVIGSAATASRASA